MRKGEEMKKVIKKSGKLVQAYCLGIENKKVKELMAEGLLTQGGNGRWRVFSQEAEQGELAQSGDYIKIDSKGRPYPNTREIFLKNHKAAGENLYEQIPHVLEAWDSTEDMCPEMEFLIKNKGLVMNDKDEPKYYKAPLWGDILTAGKDAVIVFYSIKRDVAGNIVDAEFNFVAREEFEKTYTVLE